MRCGVGDYTKSLAHALASQPGQTVGVVTDMRAAEAAITATFEVMPLIARWNFSGLPALRSAVNGWRPDILHIHYPTQGYTDGPFPYLLPTLLRPKNIPIVETWHEYPPISEYRYNLLMAASADALVVIRPHYLEKTPRFLRWLMRKTVFQEIPNASVIPAVSLTENEKRTIREKLIPDGKALIAYFGFVYPHKGVELLFSIADPAKHHLILICELSPTDAYHKKLLDKINQASWKGRVTVTGFTAPEEAARYLAASDAAVFPFRSGGGAWNSSIHAAAVQGTFIITTSTEFHGYIATENIYYARLDDIGEMRLALDQYSGLKREGRNSLMTLSWSAIAERHLDLYRSIQRS